MKALGSVGRLRAYAYGLVTTAVVLVFALAERGTEQFVSDRSRIAGTAIEVSVALLLTLAFRPVHRRVEVAIEAAFTRRRREAREALARLKGELTSFSTVEQVLRRVVEAVDHQMSTAGCAVYLRRDGYVSHATSFDAAVESVAFDDALVVRLRSASAPVDPRALGSAAAGELAFPMMAAGELIGFLTLTPKRIEYEAEDRQAVGALAEAAGIALLALDSQLRSSAPPRHNLPQAITSFVGRDEVIAEIQELLTKHRLVTLVGTGGTGKTRCATHVGTAWLNEAADGVWLIELASISDPSLVANVAAQTLGVRESGSGSRLDALVAHLQRKHALLILDNCEHVIAEARNLAAAILRNCPDIRIIATSREALNIAGEALYRMPSLSVPPLGQPLQPDDVLAFDAPLLFAHRASAADRDFAVTAENAEHVSAICRKLDGIPLAIELAAARVKVLPPRQLADRLDERLRVLTRGDRAAELRHQTMRALIDWSYDLLDERERTLFRRLSVFSGGWTLRSAAEVCGSDGPGDWEVLELLTSLVDKSLVLVEPSADGPRYRMFSLMREYGIDRLQNAGEWEAIEGQFVRFYAALVERLLPLVHALEDVEWQRHLQPELDNVRTAIDWTILQGHEPHVGLSLLANIEWPELLTTPHEAHRWYESAAALEDAMPNPLVHARVLRHLVVLNYQVGGSIAQRVEYSERAVALARTGEDANEIARALATLGSAYRSAARFDEASTVFAQAYRAPGELSLLATTSILRQWAVTDLQRGAVDLARDRFSEVARLERPGSMAHAHALLNLGELEFAAGNLEAARDAARQAKDTYSKFDSVYLVLLLSNLAAYALAAGDLEDARTHLREALDLQRESGAGWRDTVVEGHAVLASAVGDFARAAELVGFTDARYAARGEVRQYTESSGYKRLMKALAEAFAPDELARRMREGARLTEEQALASAAAIHEPIAAKAALVTK